MRKGRTDVRHAEMLHEELGQLDDPGCDGAHLTREIGVVHLLSKVGVKLSHHRHAGGRWRNDDLGSREDANEPTGKLGRVILVAGVEVQLTAAGLSVRKLDLVAEAFEHLHGRDARLGEQRVVEARDEERDAHGGA